MPSPSSHRRMFEEYATLEYLLIGDLRAALDEARDEASHRWLVAVSEAIRDALPRKTVVTRTVVTAVIRGNASRVNPADVEELCADQGRILGTYRELHAGLTDAARFLSASRPFEAPLVDWMNELSNHNRRLAALLDPYLDSADA
jgi:hypothetical protein